MDGLWWMMVDVEGLKVVQGESNKSGTGLTRFPSNNGVIQAIPKQS